MSWRQILFAVDLAGAVAPRILHKVAHLALALDAEVELFHCFSGQEASAASCIGSVEADQAIGDAVERCSQELESIAKRLRDCGVRTRTSVRWDYPVHEGIVRQVLRHKPDLVVVQSTRHPRISRVVLSHTDFRLIETCPCPLLLLKTGTTYTNTSVVAAVDPMHAHDKPAVLDEVIVEVASALSNTLGAELHVCHAYAPWPKLLDHSVSLRELPEPVYTEVCAAYQEKSESRVKALARSVKVPDDGVHITWGDAAELLPVFARSLHASLVVMGAVSRSRLERVFIGHTAERVLDALGCDILVVKPPGFQTSVGSRPTHPRRSAARVSRLQGPTVR